MATVLPLIEKAPWSWLFPWPWKEIRRLLLGKADNIRGVCVLRKKVIDTCSDQDCLRNCLVSLILWMMSSFSFLALSFSNSPRSSGTISLPGPIPVPLWRLSPWAQFHIPPQSDLCCTALFLFFLPNEISQFRPLLFPNYLWNRRFLGLIWKGLDRWFRSQELHFFDC